MNMATTPTNMELNKKPLTPRDSVLTLRMKVMNMNQKTAIGPEDIKIVVIGLCLYGRIWRGRSKGGQSAKY